MSRNRSIVLVLLLLTAGFTTLGWWFSQREEQARDADLAPPMASQEPPTAPSKLSGPDHAVPRAEAIVADSAAAIATPDVAATAQPSSGGWTVSGRALDVTGNPVAGLSVFEASHEGHVRALTSGDGTFSFVFDGKHVEVAAQSTTWSTLRNGSVSKDGPHDGALVLVVPVSPRSGRVVDDAGSGIDGARVRFEVGDAVLDGFPLPLDRTSGVYPSVHVTKDGGTFAFPMFPRWPGTRVLAEADGYEWATIEADPVDDGAELRVVLKSALDSGRAMHGVVVHADGTPARDARVWLGERSTGVDAAGAFTLTIPQWLQGEMPLVAVETGSQAAVVTAYGQIARAGPFPLPSVRLTLGPPPLSITGRVVDAAGRPLANRTVGIVRGTNVSVGRVPAITAEDLTAGGSLEDLTDAEGSFTLKGLLDREYVLYAYDSRTLVRIESNPIPAGARDVELKVPAGATVARVSGRVVAVDGSALEGAVVSIGLVTAREQGGSSWITGQVTHTDRDGAFEFADVPVKYVHFDVGGDAVIPTTFPLADVDLSRPVRIEVARRCHFRIEGLPPSSDTHWLTAVDTAGKELNLWEFQSQGWSSTNRLQLTTDTTRVYAVSEIAVELVLYHPYDTVIGKRPLRLVPNDVTILRW